MSDKEKPKLTISYATLFQGSPDADLAAALRVDDAYNALNQRVENVMDDEEDREIAARDARRQRLLEEREQSSNWQTQR